MLLPQHSRHQPQNQPRTALVVGAAISVAVVSCDNGPTSPTRPAIAGTRGDLIPGSGQSYSGQDIFRGVLLGDGPVADMIHEIRQNAQISNLITDSASLSAYRRFEDELIAELTTEDSRFFDRFSTDMHSGDPVTVEAAEQRASLAAIDAVRNLPEIRVLRDSAAKDPEFLSQTLDNLHSGEVSAAVMDSTNTASASGGLRPLVDGDTTIYSGPRVPTRADSAIDAAMTQFLVGTEPTVSPNFLGLFKIITNFLLVYHAVAIAQSAGVAVNIAVAVNFYVAVAAEKAVIEHSTVWVSGGGGGTTRLTQPYSTDGGGNDLLYEQMIGSTATVLAR